MIEPTSAQPAAATVRTSSGWGPTLAAAFLGAAATLAAGLLSLPLLLGQLQESTAQLRHTVAKHDETLGTLSGLTERTIQLDRQIAALERQTAAVADLSTRVTKLESWNPAMGVLERRVEALDGRADSALTKILELERLQQQIVETTGQLNSLRDRIRRLRSTEEKLSGLTDSQLAQLETLIQAVRDDGFQTELAYLRRRFDETLARMRFVDGALVVDAPLLVMGLLQARSGISVESESHRAHYAHNGIAFQDKQSWKSLEMQHVAPLKERDRNDLIVSARVVISDQTGMGCLMLRDSRPGKGLPQLMFVGGADSAEGRLTFDGTRFSLLQGSQRSAQAVDLHVDRLVLRQNGLIFAKPVRKAAENSTLLR